MENVKKFVYYLKKSGLRQTMRLVLGHVWGSVRVLLFRSGAKVCWNAKAPEVASALAGKTGNYLIRIFSDIFYVKHGFFLSRLCRN